MLTKEPKNKFKRYLHATKGWKTGDPPSESTNVIAVETHSGIRNKWPIRIKDTEDA